MVIKITTTVVLEPFLNEPFDKLHLADISRQINQPHPTVRQHLNYLEQQGILIKEIKGRNTLYCLNIINPLIFHYLSMSECNRLITFSENNLVFKEIVLFFNEYTNESDSVIVFGSEVIDFKRANDVDILIIGDISYQEDIDKLADRLNKKLHVVNVKSFDDVSYALKKEILAKHLIIQGMDGVLRWLLKKR
ncbi:MAG: helix-turn-helix domain-containing protein [DPANN group archaeon]|nr:helix-turn-helix domain-containing protein [DPANN group archaeon]